MDDEKIYIRSNSSNIELAINGIIVTLENCKFDLTYQDKLKFPLSPTEKEYFEQSMSRIDGGIKLLEWLKTQIRIEKDIEIPNKTTFQKIKEKIWNLFGRY